MTIHASLHSLSQAPFYYFICSIFGKINPVVPWPGKVNDISKIKHHIESIQWWKMTLDRSFPWSTSADIWVESTAELCFFLQMKLISSVILLNRLQRRPHGAIRPGKKQERVLKCDAEGKEKGRKKKKKEKVKRKVRETLLDSSHSTEAA